MTTAAIEIANLQRRLGTFHLGPLNLTVPRGAIYGLIGPNGAGKTTALDLLMGMGSPDAGHITMLGRDLERDEVEIKRRTAYVSPDLNYLPWGTVGRAIEFISGFYPDWDQQRCERLQMDFGMHRDENIAALSFGARIKLALILALSRDAELLLLDEPTVGLDAIARRQLFSELLAFMQREERTILISSHQLADLERFADHIAIIDKGKLLLAGRIDELLDRYRQLDVSTGTHALAPVAGVRLLKREGDRAQLLLDRTVSNRESLTALGIDVISERPLTLEDLFLQLLAGESTPVHGVLR
jgi:ABC-2 type transport system ATP-binding protein